VQDTLESPLADVFITISAGPYIVSGKTDEGGVLYFHKIDPSKYYVTVLKKEYSFGSEQHSVEIGDQEHVVKVMTAEKTSFSAYGTLTNLAGVPIG